MKKLEIFESLAQYEALFNQFITDFAPPPELFTRPDHFAVKCANAIDYLETCLELQEDPAYEDVEEAEEDHRLLATARRIGTVSISGHGFDRIEIMEPRSGNEPSEGFVEHTEFTVPSLEETMGVFLKRGLSAAELRGNAAHDWIEVPIGYGREIKFNVVPLDEVIAKERAEGALQPFGLL